MIRRVTDDVKARIIELKVRHGLTNVIIAERLGISPTTVKVYMRKFRQEGGIYLPSNRR
jgi:transposase-like protein